MKSLKHSAALCESSNDFLYQNVKALIILASKCENSTKSASECENFKKSAVKCESYKKFCVKMSLDNFHTPENQAWSQKHIQEKSKI